MQPGFADFRAEGIEGAEISGYAVAKQQATSVLMAPLRATTDPDFIAQLRYHYMSLGACRI